MSRARFRFVPILRAVFCLVVPAFAAPCSALQAEKPGAQKTQTPSPAADPQAKAALDKMFARYKAMRSYRAQATVTLSVEGGAARKSVFAVLIVVQRPNRVKILVEGAGADLTEVLADGKTLTAYSSRENAYREAPCPATLADFDFSSAKSVPAFGARLVLRMLQGGLSRDSDLQAMFDSATIAPPQKIDKRDVTVVRLPIARNGATAELSIGKDDGLLYRVATNPPKNARTGVRVTEMHEHIAADPEMRPEEFVFKPPKGAKKSSP